VDSENQGSTGILKGPCFLSVLERTDREGQLESRQGLSIGAEMSEVLSRVRAVLEERSVDCYLTGGLVRDAIMGRLTSDIDVVVAADAMEVAREVAEVIHGRYVPLDQPHGIARVVVPGETHLHLDFASMRGSIEEDLACRDFTINAMAVNLYDIDQPVGPLIDPLGGEQDLQDGQVRALSEAALREDPARLIRGVRLAAELGFSIEGRTKAQIERNHHLITRVAAERVRDEFCRLLALPGAAASLRLLDELGLLMAIVPELTATKGAAQPKEHFWDVLQHSFETVAAIEFVLRAGGSAHWDEAVLGEVPWSEALARHFDEEPSKGRSRKTLLKLAGLLHDIAKPQTRSVEEDGRTRFFGHAKEGALVADDIMRRLRFSARETDMVAKMVDYHLRPGQMGGETPTRRAIYRYFRDAGDVGIDTIFLNLADHLATRGPELEMEGWREHTRSVAYVLEERFREESVVAPPKLVSGHDLIDIYGMTPGPGVGELLEVVREAQAAGEVVTRDDALSFVRKRLTAGDEVDITVAGQEE